MLKQPPLQGIVSLEYRLDDLFLDTTYCDSKYAHLPTQEEAIMATIDIAQKQILECKKNGKKALFLFGSYSIGKERIYLSVARNLGEKVYVDSRRHKMFSCLQSEDWMRLLTTSKADTFLWVVPIAHINFSQMQKYLDTLSSSNNKIFSQKKYDCVIGFRPTGWSFAPGRKDIIGKRSNAKCTIFDVPYSEHSSFSELVDCLFCLKPKKIIPTVSVTKSEEQVDLLLTAVRDKHHCILQGN